jgi:hypothetical protein
VQPRNRTTTNFRHISTKKLYLVSIIIYIIVILWLTLALRYQGQMTIVVCPSKLLYHIPCPGCGITRSTLLFIRGYYIDSLKLNPNVLLSICFVLGFPIVVIFEIITGKRTLLLFYKYLTQKLQNRVILTIFLIFEIIVWIHNILNNI